MKAPASPARFPDVPLLVALLVTGAVALGLEVLWSRALIAWVGGTALAQIMTVAVYMLGLFLGAAVASPWAPRCGDPRRLFLVLEAGAAVISGLAIVSLPLARPLFALLARGTLLSSDLGSALRGLLGGAFILPATILMGMAFPLAIAALQRRRAGSGAAALAYGINTLGATLGTLAGGFFLVPYLGVRQGALALVGIDLVVLWTVARTARASLSFDDVAAEPDISKSTNGAMLLAITLGGMLSLGLEVVLFRLLGMLLGPTARAFTIVLGAYVFGLGFGALAVRRWVARGPRVAQRIFYVCWLFVGVAGIVAWQIIAARPDLLLPAGQPGDLSSIGGALRRVQLPLLLLVPFTTAFGASYSAAVAAGHHGSPARAARLYAALTLGNILGLAVTAVFLLPRWALESCTLGLFATAFLVPLPLLLVKARGRPRGLLAASGCLALFAASWLHHPAWNWKLLNTAPYLYSGAAESDQDRFFLFFRSGFETTVAVEKQADTLRFTLDGKTDGSNIPGDMSTQSFLGVLPTLVHPGPRSGLVIGLGTGQTVAEMLRFPYASVDCAELAEAVVDALPWFDSINERCYDNPKLNILKTDGRTMLRYGKTRYDVIVSEPSNVWVPGVAHLFTRETFVEARERLAPGGVFCQWLHAYGLDRDAFLSVVRTLLDVFPHVSLWTTSPASAEALFLSSEQPLSVPLDEWQRRLEQAGIRNYMAPGVNLSAASVLRNFVAGPQRLRALAGDGPLTRDQRPRLEYAAEAAMTEDVGGEFHALLRELLEDPGGMLVAPTQEQLALTAGRTAANQLLFALQDGSASEAADPVAALLRDHPGDPEAMWTCASRLANRAIQLYQSGDARGALQLLEQALEVWPTHQEALRRKVGILQGTGQIRPALETLDRIDATYQGHGVYPQLLRAELMLGQASYEAAGRSYREALDRDPYCLPALLNLATLAITSDPGRGRELVERARRLDPDNQNVARVARQLGMEP